MSNRNKKSKSPQLQQPKNIDKDLMKYLIYQKIVKPQVPLELITKTQPDEDSEVEDFKLEIEMKYSRIQFNLRYKSCKINHTFKFPKENYESSSDTSLQSLKDVTIYNLNCDNLDRLTDATQPHFMKALNERLMKLTDLIVDESQVKNKQYNYAPNLKSSRMQKLRGTNISNTSITKPTELSLNAASQSQGRESVITKPPSNLGFRATPTISSEKKNRSKQIQQILKITQQKCMNNQNIGGTFYKKTPQVNNNYININSNINNSIVVAGKRNIQDIRIKTEQEEPEPSLHQYQVIPNSRPKMRESTMKGKKLDISIGYKNLTLDSQYLETYSRNTKSQNKNYKV
ncbi:unnamed protein product (macronuclear) [Paramecium tetraurelia]|uniref:Uncharacterized protein n=1 Tax=Paramecium tetraurelia TaxID=5888 RepID=A0CXF3_PARTE|nr:uncharacterized protein GSPATT00011102001 [Paramecium tetraurelia]CAK75470.1 unnamed protein product [Paramecium tetraurelia]|eukprot:XP_001442867.1 hypothetical protein (macronuclear) [Paramecium tetraurelia strain d4-2]